MQKIKKYCLISFIAFSFISFYTYAQSKDSTEIVAKDTVQAASTSEVPRFKIRLIPYRMDKKFFLGEKDYHLPLVRTNTPHDDREVFAGQKSLEELKTELNVYLQERRDLLPNYDLGDFSVCLEYGTTAAAIILAIMHISKYGFK